MRPQAVLPTEISTAKNFSKNENFIPRGTFCILTTWTSEAFWEPSGLSKSCTDGPPKIRILTPNFAISLLKCVDFYSFWDLLLCVQTACHTYVKCPQLQALEPLRAHLYRKLAKRTQFGPKNDKIYGFSKIAPQTHIRHRAPKKQNFAKIRPFSTIPNDRPTKQLSFAPSPRFLDLRGPYCEFSRGDKFCSEIAKSRFWGPIRPKSIFRLGDPKIIGFEIVSRPKSWFLGRAVGETQKSAFRSRRYLKTNFRDSNPGFRSRKFHISSWTQQSLVNPIFSYFSESWWRAEKWIINRNRNRYLTNYVSAIEINLAAWKLFTWTVQSPLRST